MLSIQDPRHYTSEELLRDGGSICLRAIRPDDQPQLRIFFENLSRRSTYFRFFQSSKRLSEAELQHFTAVDFVRDVTLVATLRDGDQEHIVGVGHAIGLEDHGQPASRAEVAFAIAEAHQGRGIATLLLERLAAIARTRGVHTFEAYVLGENNRMLDVFEASGFTVQRSLAGGVFHVSFPTEETPQSRAASAQRERLAAARSMRAFLNPQAVAVVGASTRAGSVGAALVNNLRQNGFCGTIYPIHPHCKDIAGLPAFPQVSAIGAPVDLALVAVPAAAVPEVVADCVRAGVHGVVVISAGFAETSAAGRDIERQLRDLVRASGMRMVGPNCMGLLNTATDVRLNATFTIPTLPPAGNIGMVSQSGALGLALLDHVQALHIGVSTFLSVGNRADVSSNDMLAYWADDPHTDVLVLYLESFGNPRRFARLAPEVARKKPIIAVKSGRSVAGARAASSHSAALANREVAVAALFEQAGVIRANTLQELFDVARLLASQPVPQGARVGVVTNAGGLGILFADMSESHGLTLPELSPETRAALRTFLPAQASVANPVDMIAAAPAEHYRRTIELVGQDPHIDALVAIYIPPQVTAPQDIAQAIADSAGTVPASKPVLTVFTAAQGTPECIHSGPRGTLPTYTFPENAALALAAAARYGQWQKRPQGTTVSLSPFAHSAVRAVIDRIMATTSASVWVSPADLATILQAAGIPLAMAVQTSVAEAVPTAERLGYPLVAKIVSPDVLHKSDVGGVIMGLHHAEEVAAAVARLQVRTQEIGARLEGVLLQRQVSGGIEALVGVTTDAVFGPLLVCGLGGTLVEVLADVAFRLTPVSNVDATEMLQHLRAQVLLDGYRGAPPGDREALIDLLLHVSALVESVPELQELDLNPVKVLAPGEGVVALDARMRLAPVGAQDATARSAGA